MRHSAFILFALAACSEPAPPAPPPAAPPSQAVATPSQPLIPPISIKGRGAPRTPTPGDRMGPEGPQTARSTGPEIYLGNLASRGKVLNERYEKFPREPAVLAALATWHEEQAMIDGDLEHSLVALDLIEKALAEKPDDPKLLRHRAGLRAHLHRFPEAKADLERAIALAPDEPDPRRALGAVLRNQGDWAAAEPLLKTPLIRQKTFQDHGDEAIRAFQAGRIDEADQLLRRAAGAYADVHPIPMGWIDLQRGLLRLRTGRYPEARTFFKSAYDRLPQNYVVAEHLAEVESLLGNHAESLRIYDEVVAATKLPEFMAARAGVLSALGRAAEAEAALTEADARWKALLARHESALAAHAISFWLEDKPDFARARELAEKNLTLRRDPDSLVLAAQARAATGDAEGARALIAEARRFPIRVDEFFAGIADALHRIGDAAGAQAALAEARALNPLTPDL